MSSGYQSDVSESGPSAIQSTALTPHQTPLDTTSLLFDLQNELLLETMTFLEGENGSLVAFLKSCRQLKHIAEETLYRTINISPFEAEHVAYLSEPSSITQNELPRS
jgi:hypothetical protein